MSRPKSRKNTPSPAQTAGRDGPQSVRVIGGTLRGRRLKYSGDPRTRPMKDRVREAVFNLVRESIAGHVAIDLFAGTGVLGFEALSRGAAAALLLERHHPTARLIRENAGLLGVESQAIILATDTLTWSRQHALLDERPWLVFCSPPYDLFVEQPAEMLNLIGDLCRRAPADSAVVVEADERFDFETLSPLGEWQVRSYPPAVICIWQN